MKVGSLVVVKPLGVRVGDTTINKNLIKWLPEDNETTVYTIRGINPKGKYVGAVLEEGIIGYDTKGFEIEIKVSHLKEVQPPISSEEIAELVEDACCVERS